MHTKKYSQVKRYLLLREIDRKLKEIMFKIKIFYVILFLAIIVIILFLNIKLTVLQQIFYCLNFGIFFLIVYMVFYDLILMDKNEI